MSEPYPTPSILGLCVHDHCPLDGPHWHGGIWRSGHVRDHPDADSVSRVQAIEAAEDHADQTAFDAARERRL